MNIRTIVLFILFNSLSFFLSAQKSYSKNALEGFKYLTQKEGFKDNTIYSIIQDQKGFMWFGGADGLYKYDGNTLIHIKNNYFKDQSITHSIYQIKEDKKNKKLWFICNNHLFTLDLNTEQIEKKEIELSVNSTINEIDIDSNGILWIGTNNNGIYLYKESENKIVKWNRISELDKSYISKIEQYPNGEILIASLDNGIYFYHPQKDAIDYYPPTPETLCAYKDKKGNLWVGSMSGLKLYNKQTFTYETVQIDQSTSVFAITDIVEEDGVLLFSTDRGLFSYNDEKGQYSRINHDYSTNGGLNSNYINDLYIDRDKTLWIATYFGGVNYISPYNQNFVRYDFINKKMEGHVVSSFAEDKEGNLWIGTEDGGISFYNRHEGSVSNYNPQHKKIKFLDFFNIHALYIDEDDLYIGTSMTGVDIYNLKNKTHTKIKEGLSSYSISSIAKVSDEEIALGTYEGLDIYNTTTKEIQRIKRIPLYAISCILKDESDGVWICGPQIGVYYKSQNKSWNDLIRISKDFPSQSIYTIAQHKNDILFGTENGGIIRYNLKSNTYKHLLADELNGDIVYKIIPENDFLWINTSKGLYQFNIQTNKLFLFSESDGIRFRDPRSNSGIRTQDGTIFLGGENGLIGYRTTDIKQNETDQSTTFTYMILNNHRRSNLPNEKYISKNISYQEEISIPYDQAGLIGIEFSSLNYTKHDKKTYQYQLSPFHNKWIQTTSNQIYFSLLSPGVYTLKVKSDCTYDKGDSIKIHILRPWWSSWYMLILYFILLSGVAYRIYRKFNQKTKVQETEIDRTSNDTSDQNIISEEVSDEKPESQKSVSILNEKDSTFLENVNNIIYDHLSNPKLSAQFCATEMCMGRTNFFLKIKETTGTTFVDYVRNIRMKKAIELLKRQENSISEIAEITGFSSMSYFCNCFKKQFNMTPSEYQKSLKSEN